MPCHDLSGRAGGKDTPSMVNMIVAIKSLQPTPASLRLFKRPPRFWLPPGMAMRCVKDDHTAINMTLHYLDNGTVMLNFIYQKELFFLPLGFALKVARSWSGFEKQML